MKKLINVSIIAVTVVLIMSNLTIAQEINFTGKWDINVEKSDFGMNPAPQGLTLIIKHKDKNLEVEQVARGNQIPLFPGLQEAQG